MSRSVDNFHAQNLDRSRDDDKQSMMKNFWKSFKNSRRGSPQKNYMSQHISKSRLGEQESKKAYLQDITNLQQQRQKKTSGFYSSQNSMSQYQNTKHHTNSQTHYNNSSTINGLENTIPEKNYSRSRLDQNQSRDDIKMPLNNIQALDDVLKKPAIIPRQNYSRKSSERPSKFKISNLLRPYESWE